MVYHCDLLVGQQLPHPERSVCRRIVMVEHPGLVFLKSWSAVANPVVEAVEDLLIEVLVYCLVLRHKLLMHQTLLIEESDQHGLDYRL